MITAIFMRDVYLYQQYGLLNQEASEITWFHDVVRPNNII